MDVRGEGGEAEPVASTGRLGGAGSWGRSRVRFEMPIGRQAGGAEEEHSVCNGPEDTRKRAHVWERHPDGRALEGATRGRDLSCPSALRACETSRPLGRAGPPAPRSALR